MKFYLMARISRRTISPNIKIPLRKIYEAFCSKRNDAFRINSCLTDWVRLYSPIGAAYRRLPATAKLHGAMWPDGVHAPRALISEVPDHVTRADDCVISCPTVERIGAVGVVIANFRPRFDLRREPML